MNWRAGAEPLIGEPLSDTPWPVSPKNLLTERERSLYERLLVLYPDHKLFIQVALSQLIDVPTKHPDRHSIRNRFSQLVADFVLCRKDLSVVAVIELDDPSHQRPDRQYADARKNKALTDAGFRLVRIPAGRLPLDDALRKLFDGEDTRRIIPHGEVVLTLAEDVYPGEIASNAEEEPSEISREFKRIGLKALFIIVLILGSWIFYSYLLPAFIQRAFQPVAVHPHITPPPAQPVAAVRPQRSTPFTVSGPIAAEVATRKEWVLRETNVLQRRRDLAWAAFYSAPASCEHPVDWSAQVECGNMYMQATKVFAKKWAAEHPDVSGGAVMLDNSLIPRSEGRQ